MRHTEVASGRPPDGGRALDSTMDLRRQHKQALAVLVTTLAGLVILFAVPVLAGLRLRFQFAQIAQLEHTRQYITETIEAAHQSDTFLMHRYMVPGATDGRYVPDTEYQRLIADWKNAVTRANGVKPLNAEGRMQWSIGCAGVSRWIEQYLHRYTGSGSAGGSSDFEAEERRFRTGFNALQAARDQSTDQLEELRASLQWLNRAQVAVIAPMAAVCFALAVLAWLNLRALQQSWVRERATRSALEIAVQESNHRIKNNLQVIGALIDMKVQEPGTTVPKSALMDIVHQVRAVAAVHDFFSHELRSGEVQSDQLLRRLVDLTASPIGLQVDLKAEALGLAVKQATAVALITNELLLNSGKHGATAARIHMTSDGSAARLQVTDNGPGFPPGFDAARSANLGLALVDTLVRHDLHGHICFSNVEGAQVAVTFPLDSAA